MQVTLAEFLRKYAATEKPEAISVHKTGMDKGLVGQLISVYGGTVFDRGVYRLHDWDNVDLWSKEVGRAFPEFDGKVVVFGQDWQGNQFGWRNVGDPKVLLFQIGS